MVDWASWLQAERVARDMCGDGGRVNRHKSRAGFPHLCSYSTRLPASISSPRPARLPLCFAPLPACLHASAALIRASGGDNPLGLCSLPLPAPLTCLPVCLLAWLLQGCGQRRRQPAEPGGRASAAADPAEAALVWRPSQPAPRLCSHLLPGHRAVCVQPHSSGPALRGGGGALVLPSTCFCSKFLPGDVSLLFLSNYPYNLCHGQPMPRNRAHVVGPTLNSAVHMCERETCQDCGRDERLQGGQSQTQHQTPVAVRCGGVLPAGLGWSAGSHCMKEKNETGVGCRCLPAKLASSAD